MPTPTHSAARWLVACGLAASAAAHADPFTTLGPFVDYRSTGGLAATVHDTSWVSVDSPSTYQGVAGTLRLGGQGAVGVARAVAQGTSGGYSASVFAGWHDLLTFTPADPALLGQTALVRFDLAYDWSALVPGAIVVGPGNSAFVDMSVKGPTGPWRYSAVVEDITQSCAAPGSCGSMWIYTQETGVPEPGFAGGVARFTFRVVLGAPHDVVFGMNAVG